MNGDDTGWQMVEPDARVFRRGRLGGKDADLVWVGMLGEIAAGAVGARVANGAYHDLRIVGIVERLPPGELIPFWHEVYRICRHGSTVTVIGAYWSHVDVAADPTRYRGLSERMFAYLSSEERAAIEADPYEDGVATSQLADVDMRATKITRVTEPSWDTRSDEAKSWGLRHAINVARRLEVVLTVHKAA